MFCPGCGIEDQNINQFCRACGTDLRPARKVLAMPDAITASAATAREELGRAFAAKIREAQTGVDLKIVAEDVLPEIEKFLESPEERRLRRIRVGTLVSFIGFGAALGFTIASAMMGDSGIMLAAALGVVAFFVGLSFIVNGLLLTVPKKTLSDKRSDAESQRAIEAGVDRAGAQTNELALPAAGQIFASVTEETTRHLGEKNAVPHS